QGGQHVYRRQDTLAVKVTGKDDLALGDIAGQVGDGVGLVILRHGEDGDHGDGTLVAQLPAGTLIHGGKVGVEVTGIAAAAGDFLPGGGDLTEGFRVVGDIRQDNQHVHALFKGQIFRSGQGHTGGRNTLNSGVVG